MTTRPMERATHGGTGRPPVPGVTAREIAEGTGMSLSSVYRAIHELQGLDLILKIPRNVEGQGPK